MKTTVISNSIHMQCLDSFIVHIPQAVKETVTVGGQEMYLSSKFSEFEHRIPQGTVVAVPAKHKTPVKVGDTVYLHHHVMVDGMQVMDEKKRHYRAEYDPSGGFATQVYAYENEEGLHMLTNWVFVEPVKQPKKITSDIIEIVSLEPEENRYGRIMFDSDALAELGVKKGDIVLFSKNSDYEMEVQGKKVWRMYTDHIMAICYDYKE